MQIHCTRTYTRHGSGRVIAVLYALRARASQIRRTSKLLTRDALRVTRTAVVPRLRGRKRAQTQARTRAPWLRVIAVLSAPRAWIRRAHTTRKRRTVNFSQLRICVFRGAVRCVLRVRSRIFQILTFHSRYRNDFG